MAQTIKLKRSAVAAKEPGTGDLALGELAINTYDGKMYFKKDSGTASIVRLANIGEVVTLTGDQTIAGVKTFSNTTASSSTTTGALVVAGGVGIAGALHTGADAVINGVTVGKGANSVGFNTAIGNGALAAITEGYANTAIGHNALNDATSSTSNTALGLNALGAIVTSNSVTGGNANTALGRDTLQSMTVGTGNVAVGIDAGRYRTSSNTNLTIARSSVFIGSGARAAGNDQTNQVVIGGENAVGNGSNTTTLGNSSTTGTFIPAGNLTLSNGNLILGTAGNGISFAATGDAGNVPARAAGAGISGTATNVADNDTVTLGANTYTFKATLTPADYEVKIGGTSADSMINLGRAINNSGGVPGTDYQVPSANASATAAYVNQSGIPYLQLTAITPGAAGNSITLNEASAQLTRAVFSGGADAVTNPATETLDDYEEGTWDPVYAPATGAFDGVSMRVHEARYIKVGRMVTLFGAINANIVVGSASGLLRITGLPYTPVTTVAVGVATGTRYAGNVSYSQNFHGNRPNAVSATSNTTFLTLSNLGTGDTTETTTANIDQRPLGNRLYLVFRISYPAA